VCARACAPVCGSNRPRRFREDAGQRQGLFRSLSSSPPPSRKNKGGRPPTQKQGGASPHTKTRGRAPPFPPPLLSLSHRLRVDQRRVAQVVEPPRLQDGALQLEPHPARGQGRVARVLCQQLGRQAPQGAEHGPARVDDLGLAEAGEGLGVGREADGVPPVVAGELLGSVFRGWFFFFFLGGGLVFFWVGVFFVLVWFFCFGFCFFSFGAGWGGRGGAGGWWGVGLGGGVCFVCWRADWFSLR